MPGSVMPFNLAIATTFTLFTAVATSAFAQAPPSAVELPTVSSPYLVLIRDPVIQELLKLDEKQQQAVQRLTDQVDGPLWRTRAMTAEQSAVEVARLVAKTRLHMADILTPAQQERLAQAELRALGMKSLFLPSVRAALKLNDSQLKTIATTLDDTQQEQAKLRKTHAKDAKLLEDKLDKLFVEEKKKIADILDESQHRELSKLVGEPFDVSKLGNVRFKAPEFDATDGWLNTRGLRMADLRGRVTVLHFWTYG